MKRYVQIYTGDGKGKTTASLGLAVRAAGAGLKVMIVQFMKKGDYSEKKTLEKIKNITLKQYGTGRFIRGAPSLKERKAGKKAFKMVKKSVMGGNYDVVIADEGNVAVLFGLAPEKKWVELMKSKPNSVELVITGRGAGRKMIAKADLVTNMEAVKHYYEKGVGARKGIEK